MILLPPARRGRRLLVMLMLAFGVLHLAVSQAWAFGYVPYWSSMSPTSSSPPPTPRPQTPSTPQTPPITVTPPTSVPPPPVLVPPPPVEVTPPEVIPVEPPIGTPPIATETAPEPTTLVTGLFGSGLAGAFVLYRRKRRAAKEVVVD